MGEKGEPKLASHLQALSQKLDAFWMEAWVKNTPALYSALFRYIWILQCEFNLFTHSKGKTKMIANAWQLNYLSWKEKGGWFTSALCLM